jgi:hypothetical protein
MNFLSMMSQNVERLFDFQYTAHEEAKMASQPCAVLSGRFKRTQVKTDLFSPPFYPLPIG